MHGIGLVIMSERKFNEEKVLLIAQFNDIIEAFDLSKENNKHNKCKDYFIPLIEKIKKYSEKKDERNANFYINEIIDVLKNNEEKKKIKKKIFDDLLIKILIKEKRKNNKINENLISIIFFKKDKYEFFNDHLMIIPFIEEAFFDKFNYNNIRIINDKMFDDINRYLEEINKIIDKNKILEEKILFYFETKIMMNLDREFNKETNNEKKKEKLKLFGQFLNLLESLLLKKNENNKKIIQLYSIAFIKCFLNKLVYICLKDEQKIGVLSEYNKIIAGDN